MNFASFYESLIEKSIYKFSNTNIKTTVPHYHICIKKTEEEVYFSCCTTKLDTLQNFVEMSNLPLETIYTIYKGKNFIFNSDTHINCNEVHKFNINNLYNSLKKSDFDFNRFNLGCINDNDYSFIINGIKLSKMIERSFKKIL